MKNEPWTFPTLDEVDALVLQAKRQRNRELARMIRSLFQRLRNDRDEGVGSPA